MSVFSWSKVCTCRLGCDSVWLHGYIICSVCIVLGFPILSSPAGSLPLSLDIDDFINGENTIELRLTIDGQIVTTILRPTINRQAGILIVRYVYIHV